MIDIVCPGCARPFPVDDPRACDRLICPHCEHRLTGTVSPCYPDPAATRVPTLETPAPEGPTSESLDFLAPALAPDELGRLGSYRVVQVLGAGGMGLVLRAEDSLLKRTVALKVMRPELARSDEARQRFVREAQAIAAIEHPHIISVYQVGQDRGVPFLAMPLLKGESLQARLDREGKLAVAETLVLGRQIAEGLAAAHENHLVHRDIKPGNIWLETRNNPREACSALVSVKILDFGLARAAAGEDARLTRTGAILGTPAYMAPEQARAEKVDSRCDLFSLGAVLYRILSGSLPFHGKDTLSMLTALAVDTPRSLRECTPEVPPALADLVERLLAKQPDQRPASAQVVADTLAGIEASLPRKLAPTPATPLNRDEGRRLCWYIPLAAYMGLIGLVFVMVLSWRERGDRAPTPSIPASPSAAAPDTSPVALPAAPPVPIPSEAITNSIGMKFVRVAPGVFLMGSPADEAERYTNEEQHEVEITRPFYVGVYEVTQEQYAHIMGENPSWFSSTGGGKERVRGMDTRQFPVETVFWEDALRFCRLLSELPEEKAKERRYRLPTEAEWEYVCRGGPRGRKPSPPFYFGNTLSSMQANFNGNYPSGSAAKGVFLARPTRVGSYPPSPLGLYDLHGNVWEWCSDWYSPDYYAHSPRQDPSGPEISQYRVLRGAAWGGSGRFSRAACRGFHAPGDRDSLGGFRVVFVAGANH